MRMTIMHTNFPETVSDSLCIKSLVMQTIVGVDVLVAGLR